MATLVPYIWGVVFGFVYLTAFFFILLSRLKIYSLRPSTDIEKYAPYLAVIVLFASSITGFVAQTLMGYGIGILFPQDAFNPANPISRHSEIGESYASLILIRHLCASTALLGVSLCIWIPKEQSRLRLYIPLSCFLFSIIFFIAYFILRHDFVQTVNFIKSTLHAP